MDNTVKISVIVPAYNAEPWIRTCIDSICTQSYNNLEIIIINDGSTDNTGEIINEYSEKDSRIIAIHQDNKGLVKTREVGIAKVTGEYTTFVDADDYIDKNMYERLLHNAIEYDADISHCGMRFCYPEKGEELHFGTGKILCQDNFSGLKDLLEGKFIEPSLCNKLYRSSLLTDSCLDLSVLNNEDLLRNYVLFGRSKKNIYEDFCGYYYIQREGSMSKDATKMIKTAEHVCKAKQLILENCSREIYPYAKQAWLSAIVNTINCLIYCKDENVKEICNQYRMILKNEENNLKYLIPRQKVAAKLMIKVPRLYKLIYNIYKIKYKLHTFNRK